MLLSHSFHQPDSSAALPARVLALDVGKKRIGLAISDDLGITAQGLETLHRTRIRDDLVHLTNLIQARGVTLLLIGRPLHMTGSESRQSAYDGGVCRALERALRHPCSAMG